MIKAIVTDIEGTTSDIRFVHQVLFPYARERIADFVRATAQDAEVMVLLNDVRTEMDQPKASLDEVIAELLRWIDEDRKATPLKALQGMIWRHGYVNGDFKSHLYEDAVNGLQAWHQAGIRLYVYSSGSVAAQKLLFGYSEAGDLTPLFSGYFDTKIGAKREVAAYQTIVRELALPAEQILFLSDIHQELDAAEAAGIQTCQLIRGEPDPDSHHRQVSRFDDISLTAKE
ncbi:acireductone synthase [Oceanisphaera psychrotolerans]|uniref:Enolase-phosphatase E1 n=1 Tax=Oceanisphaera psychrotolerans TaxID=1414654 RepID=A0A1J4QG36_9GAMM|nr:acireductone synthase [Oceanisphaera psychrotolerans]OIN12415.1 2,3-diketo-5-methylthio-1-phosphopentane phosphatase [Oceanisphaera psychrotolerans]